MKARVILKLRDGSDFSYDDCYEYDDLEKAANDIADEILKKEYVMSWDSFGVSIIPARDIKSIRKQYPPHQKNENVYYALYREGPRHSRENAGCAWVWGIKMQGR